MVTIKNLKRSPLKCHYQELRIALSSINLIWKIMFIRVMAEEDPTSPAHLQIITINCEYHTKQTVTWRRWGVYRSRHGPLDSPCPQDSNIELIFSQLLAWGQTWLAWSMEQYGCWWRNHSFLFKGPIKYGSTVAPGERGRTPEIESPNSVFP